MFKIKPLIGAALIIFLCTAANGVDTEKQSPSSSIKTQTSGTSCNVPSSKYRAIIFDLGGVLASFNIKKTIEKLQAAGMIIPGDVINKLARIPHLPEHLDYNRGSITKKEYYEKLAAKLFPDGVHKHFITEIHDAADDDLRLDTKTCDLLTTCKTHGYKIYLLSNLTATAEQHILKQSPSFFDQFDGIILSYKVHAAKPEPAIYTTLFQTYNLNPDECLFIDDMDVNIQGAKAMGMDGIVCKNIEQVIDDLIANDVLPAPSAINAWLGAGYTFKDLTTLMYLPDYYGNLDTLLKDKPSHQTFHYSDKSIGTDASTMAYVQSKMQRSIAVKTDVKNMMLGITLALEKDATIGGNGLFIEFGVGLGKSTNFIAKNIQNKTLYGFDWYKGLPEDWRAPHFLKGTFGLKPGVKIPPLPLEKNIELVVGLFKETLPDFLKEKNAPIVFMHIDCDLYSSTKEIFDAIRENVVDGTIIVFDEYFNYDGWEKHEFKAFQEFIQETGFSYEYVCYNKLHQQVTVKVSKTKAL